jgi:LysM repeat protein
VNRHPEPVAPLARAAFAPGVLAVAIAFGVVACGTTDEASRETLPPLITTTSSTTPTTTDPNEGKTKLYEIKSGESLAIIAERFQVPTQSIIDLNNIENPDNVPAGLIIEIPTDIVLIEELPDATTTTAGEG